MESKFYHTQGDWLVVEESGAPIIAVPTNHKNFINDCTIHRSNVELMEASSTTAITIDELQNLVLPMLNTLVF